MTTPKKPAANLDNTALSSQDPTTYLPDPTDSAFFRADSPGFVPLPEDEPLLEAPAFLTESRFTREREQDEADALASLDETILRPVALHFADDPTSEQGQQQTSAADEVSPMQAGTPAPPPQQAYPPRPQGYQAVATDPQASPVAQTAQQAQQGSQSYAPNQQSGSATQQAQQAVSQGYQATAQNNQQAYQPAQQAPQAASQPYEPEPQTPKRPRSWRWVAVAAAFVVAGAVGVRAYGSRQSNVGLLGVPTTAEKVAAQIDGKVTHGDAAQFEESKPTSPLDSLTVTDSYAPEEDSLGWQDDGYGLDSGTGYGSGSDGAITTDDLYEWFWNTTEDSTSTGYPSYKSPYGSGETGYEYDPYDDWLTYDRDEGSVSLTYDGNSVTYYYDDDRMTFELDDLDRYFGSLDDWYYYDPYEAPSRRHSRGW